MSQITIATPDTTQADKQSLRILAEAADLMILGMESHAEAQAMLRSIADAQKRVKELFAEPKSAAHKAHKSITALERKLLAPLEGARKTISIKLTSYEDDQRRIAEAKRLELEAEAHRIAVAKKLEDAIHAEAGGEGARGPAGNSHHCGRQDLHTYDNGGSHVLWA